MNQVNTTVLHLELNRSERNNTIDTLTTRVNASGYAKTVQIITITHRQILTNHNRQAKLHSETQLHFTACLDDSHPTKRSCTLKLDRYTSGRHTPRVDSCPQRNLDDVTPFVHTSEMTFLTQTDCRIRIGRTMNYR